MNIRRNAEVSLTAYDHYADAVNLGDVNTSSNIASAGMVALRHEAKRVLLLEKAYRYQRAAMRLMRVSNEHMFSAAPTGIVFGQMSELYQIKAAELYRQAEEV